MKDLETERQGQTCRQHMRSCSLKRSRTQKVQQGGKRATPSSMTAGSHASEIIATRTIRATKTANTFCYGALLPRAILPEYPGRIAQWVAAHIVPHSIGYRNAGYIFGEPDNGHGCYLEYEERTDHGPKPRAAI